MTNTNLYDVHKKTHIECGKLTLVIIGPDEPYIRRISPEEAKQIIQALSGQPPRLSQ